MKQITILLVLLALCIFGKTNAQMLPIGSQAPNFTLTDINNVTHNLYNYTDSGYTVVIDVSATWCPPCWTVHNSHIFDSLTAHYGPSGSIDPKKIKVFFVEGDVTTNAADLNGTGSNTQGNWVAGATYPIVDLTNTSFTTLYPIGGYPTFYIICPNRTVAYTVAGYSQAMLTEPFWVNYMNTCPVKEQGINASVNTSGTAPAVCAGSATPLNVTIQNMGTSPMTAATVEALNGTTVLASTNWTGNLNTYDLANVNIGSYTFPNGNTNVTYKITTTGDVKASDNELIKPASAFVSNYYTVTLQVRTDEYPGELSWTVKNSSNTVVQTKTYIGNGQNAGGVDASKVFDEVLVLNPNECYTLEVEDSYGDGLTAGTTPTDTGYIKLYDGLPTSSLIQNFGADFGVGFTSVFKTGSAVSVNDIISSDNFNIFPNPAYDIVNVQFDLTENSPVKLQLVDINGKVVMTNEWSNTQHVNHVVQTASLSSGIYNLSIITAKQTKNVKLVIQK